MYGLLGSILILACLVYVAFHYWERLHRENERPRARKWFDSWVIRGLAAPLVAWMVCNVGSAPIVPPMVYGIPMASTGWTWILSMARLTTPAVELVSSFWAAVTICWYVPAIASRTKQRHDFLVAVGCWCLLVFPLTGAVIAFLGWEAAGFTVFLVMLPVIHYGISLPAAEQLERPSYSRAIAKIKFGHYTEAESVVIQELEKCENDFDGWMMLADLYANHFHDVGGADSTVRELATQPETTPSQISVAFHRLADWHMRLNNDPDGAGRALEAIRILLPGTHLAHMAQLRLNQLPTPEQLAKNQTGHTLRMQPLKEEFAAPDAAAKPAEAPPVDLQEAAARANRCVEKLEQSPADVPTREQFAKILAERLGKAALAVEQIGLLLEMPGQPEDKMAEWLSLTAGWQLTLLQDLDAGQKSLERLVREYPQSTHAFAAQRRLSLMAVDRRMEKFKSAASRIRMPTG